jgi:hypothetical protein
MAGYPEPSADVITALDAGKKIEAIKMYRRDTGLGLREAKEVIDRLGARAVTSSGDVVVKTYRCDQASLSQQVDAGFRTMSAQGYVVQSHISRSGRKTLFNRHLQDEVTVTHRRSGASQPAYPPDQNSEQDRYDQLERIGRLKAEGVLNDEEFEREKHRILGY